VSEVVQLLICSLCSLCLTDWRTGEKGEIINSSQNF